MSYPSENGGNLKLLSGRHLGKALQKSTFAQTCTLLSQFLREKRGLGDVINFAEIESKDKDRDSSSETFNLLTKMENPGDCSKQNSAPTMDLLPQLVGYGSTVSIENPSNKLDLSKPANPEPATAQMTIFYKGKVAVFNDFPAEKAEEIMTMASNGISASARQGTKSTQEQVQPQPQAQANANATADMPIARRASLHRFLEKRKDRATTRAPYQVNRPPQLASSSKNEDTPTKCLDLNL